MALVASSCNGKQESMNPEAGAETVISESGTTEEDTNAENSDASEQGEVEEGTWEEPGVDYIVGLETAFDVTNEELEPLFLKAKNIYEEYGVVILIGDNVSYFTAGAEKYYEYDNIEACMDAIVDVLDCYPKDFFRNLSENDVERTVVIQIVGTGFAAGAYIGGYHYLLMQMDANSLLSDQELGESGAYFAYTLHHELFHLIDERLQARADGSAYSLTEENWNQYNPEGFEYVGYYDSEKESALYNKNNNFTYFSGSYGCSTPLEDRAIIFGSAMFYYQGYSEAPFTDEVCAKLQFLSNCMRAGFGTEDWPEQMPWDYKLYQE